MEKLIKRICITAAIAALIAIGTFISHFGLGFASNIGNWGAVGDFFGGVLNPTFALLSLILIAYTLMQNKKALEQSEKAIEQGTKAIEQNEKALQVSNEELRLTRDELANSSDALKEQANLLAVQSFETTFFNMLVLHRRLIDNFSYDYSSSHEKISKELNIDFYTAGSSKDMKPGVFCVNRLLTAIHEAHKKVDKPQSVIATFNVFYREENKEFGSYFRNLYQILKLIKDSFSNIAIQKKYSNILRAQLSNQELSLLLLNCLCSHVDNGQFKKLVIHFELLEHLDIAYALGDDNIATFTINNPTLHLTSNEIDQYISTDTSSGKLIKSAFGENSQIMDYCKFKNWVDQ
ncbi:MULTISPECIES: putative phage abortive infection protein [unclassified Pseudoalteromonas]|uniref:putative phage abortive infection protein n=1 Tax=unclassified Pseudoalteromonas TaxID=194690 RepID=UPI000C07C4E4|nr:MULTISPECIES: putative phage abortive infection protein [unclassified Pseudoalteromonas]MDP2636721.1 putative phage abortive infection protein [Pseudoalteromonas sp. 1_MG-2023]PHN89904.1 hypothetical protein CSC79_10150 [Pseudoalteromonas sp. 3D05]